MRPCLAIVLVLLFAFNAFVDATCLVGGSKKDVCNQLAFGGLINLGLLGCTDINVLSPRLVKARIGMTPYATQKRQHLLNLCPLLGKFDLTIDLLNNLGCDKPEQAAPNTNPSGQEDPHPHPHPNSRDESQDSNEWVARSPESDTFSPCDDSHAHFCNTLEGAGLINLGLLNCAQINVLSRGENA